MHIAEILMKLNICLIWKNDELLEKYNEIWYKVSYTIKKGFDSEPVYNETYLITKIKTYEEKIKTNGDKVLKEGSQCLSLSVILIDSVFKTGKIIILECF